jgi:hypothetical protein
MGIELLAKIITSHKPGDSIADLCRNSIITISEHLGIQTEFIISSKVYGHELKGSDRIIDICLKENADAYINAIGGKNLYEQKVFQDRDIKLTFLVHKPLHYAKHQIPYLSVIDLLMHCSPTKYQEVIQSYEEIK